jgi:hypothetical protein
MTGMNFYTELGREKGNMIHVACALLAWNNLDWSTVDQQIFGYVVSYAEYLEHSKFKPKRTEFQAYDPELLLAGTWDADGDSNQVANFLYDLKSGTRERWHQIQTAIYQHLATVNGISIKRRGALYLQEDGSMAKFYPHEDRNDWKVAISALNMTRWRQSA